MDIELDLFVEELSEQQAAPLGCFATYSTAATSTAAACYGTVSTFSC